MKKFSILTLPLLAAYLALSGCSKEPAKTADSGQKAAPAAVINVKAATAEGRAVDRSVEAVGSLEPWEESIVGSEVSGTVEKISADLGDRVKKGDTLALLDQREFKLALDGAVAAHQTDLKAVDREEARLADAGTTLKRYEELFKEGMVSTSQYDDARTKYDVAKAQLKEAQARSELSASKAEAARKHLDDTRVRAPISGEIKKRFVSVGEAVNPQTRLFAVVSTGTLKFRGTVAEAASPRIRTGQRMEVMVEAYKGKGFSGALTRISPAIDAQTRTLEMEAEVPNPGGVLRPGFFAKGTILTMKEPGVPFVPEAAVYSFAGVTKVFVIEGDIAHERQVRTGVRDGDMIEVMGDVKPGNTVAASGLSALYEGAKVSVIK
ncbi:MAG: efflux RND transporter periplasmic adaptor subunit [Deltaproteobacteria bacterium]|nr:efflux RND transporter periplasmic adaptor subunit [Deltaproteobacteria bacterium]